MLDEIYIDFTAARKFHSIFPLGEHQILMFGGANFNQTAGIHVVTEAYVWIFDFEKLEWSRSSSSMIQPTYFHAAAMNRVSNSSVVSYQFYHVTHLS